MFEQPRDFRDESDALADLLDPLADADFEQKTQFKDWSLHDVLAHLHIFNWAADTALRNPDEFRTWYGGLARGIGTGKNLVQLTDEWLDGVRGRKLFDVWRSFYAEMTPRFEAADPKKRVPWAGPDMSVRSSISARLMETWAHGQEVFDGLGVVRVNTDRIKNIAHLGVTTFAWTFVNRKLDPPSPVPHVRLTAPSGAVWDWNAEVETDLVEGDATEFCQVVTHVRNLADTHLRVSGPSAEQWMPIAQCFAGAVSNQPAPGSRFTAKN